MNMEVPLSRRRWRALSQLCLLLAVIALGVGLLSQSPAEAFVQEADASAQVEPLAGEERRPVDVKVAPVPKCAVAAVAGCQPRAYFIKKLINRDLSGCVPPCGVWIPPGIGFRMLKC